MEDPSSWEQSGVVEAHERIRNVIFRTPLIFSHSLSAKASNLYGNTKVYLKLESEQLTGSFKARGAFNKLILYKDSGKDFTTSSTGTFRS
jgi:threonine dehydratase